MTGQVGEQSRQQFRLARLEVARVSDIWYDRLRGASPPEDVILPPWKPKNPLLIDLYTKCIVEKAGQSDIILTQNDTEEPGDAFWNDGSVPHLLM